MDKSKVLPKLFFDRIVIEYDEGDRCFSDLLRRYERRLVQIFSEPDDILN